MEKSNVTITKFVVYFRSLISLYREQIPALLHKKDRGRVSEAQAEMKPKQYGAVAAHDHVPGAEALLKSTKTVSFEDNDDDNSDSDSWVDVNESGDEIHISDSDEESDNEAAGSDVGDKESEGEGEGEEDDEVDVGEDENEEDDDDDDDVEGEEEDEDEEGSDEDEQSENENEDDSVSEIDESAENQTKQIKQVAKSSKHKKNSKSISNGTIAVNGSSVNVLDKKQAAQEIALTRIFTDEDFKRIDAENIKKHVSNARKRPLEADQTEYVKLDDIEMIYKKRRTDKTSRLETVMRGREDREKYGYRDKRKNINCSKTNNEKKKKKNFGMMRQKARSKVKKSFKEKQQSMRKHLLRQKKMK